MILPVKAGDRILLCSDGLSDMVPESRVAEILKGPSEDPEGPARQLLSEALEAGGSDNITIVLVDVKKQEDPPPPPRKSAQPRAKSGETREMEALGTTDHSRKTSGRPTGAASSRASSRARSKRRRERKSGKKRRGGVYRRGITGLLRALAVILVLTVALTPAYLWASSRYFLEFENGEVVAYQGVPYQVLGFKLNEEWRRPGIERSEVKGPYQEPIEQQKLYTKGQVEDVLRDLRR